MSPLEPEAPPTGEEVHLPGPSVLPLLTAAGITLAVVGVTTSLILVIGGAILTIACVLRWIGDTRRDIDELPLDHH
jgi:ABC-type transport system involved in cytochrome c biogenesis permease subunit